jgi:hypothetical protein
MASRIHVEATLRGIRNDALHSRCRLDINRNDDLLRLCVEVEPCLGRRERLRPSEWEAFSAELGRHTHFDVPYLLYHTTNAITSYLVPNAPLSTGDAFPPHVYRPAGPWELLRNEHCDDYAVRASLLLHDTEVQPYAPRVDAFVASLWFLTNKKMFVSVPGVNSNDPHLRLPYHDSTAPMRLV